MRSNIESALRNVKKVEVPDSTFAKVDDVLRNLEHRKGEIRVKPKLRKSVVAAAVCIATLIITGTAFAAIKLWNQQQADLRDILNIEGKDIPEYVEYYPMNTESIIENDLIETDLDPIPDNKLNVNVLSSMKDHQFVYYYVSVSPVMLEQAENYSWHYQREDLEGWRSASPAAGTIDKAFHESSQSFLLKIPFMVGYDIKLDETEPFMATLLCFDKENPELKMMLESDTPYKLSQMRELVPNAFITTDFTIVPNTRDMAAVSFSFGNGIDYINPQTGETGLILGVEVSSGSFVWIHSYPSMEAHYTALAAGEALYLSEQADWMNSFDNAIKDAVFVMKNGSTINAPIPTSTDIADGFLRSHAHFEFPIELSALEDIMICPLID